MQEYNMFAEYLNGRLEAKGMTISEFSKLVGYVALMHVPRWFRGEALPMASDLKKIADVLDADPVVVAAGWIISQCPDLDDVVRREVLNDRTEKLPPMGGTGLNVRECGRRLEN